MSALSIVQRFFPDVTKVSDATKGIFIEVTARDAASKSVRDHGACVMAVACKRKLKLDGVIIARSVAYLIKDDHATRYLLPATVAREIVSFDRGAGFETGTYALSKISHASRMGREHSRLDPGRNRNNNGKRKLVHITTNIRSVLGGPKPEGE